MKSEERTRLDATSPEGMSQKPNKVPSATFNFWIIKIMATTVGETAADALSVNLHFGLTGTSIVMGSLLAIILYFQVRREQYVPWLYWIAVVLISVVGTLITDNLVDNFGVPLQATAIAFSAVLVATFAAWYASERTLSIQSICSTRRELFYWAAILFTFALGTAAGDLVAESYGLGYGPSALVFGALVGAVVFARYVLKANAVLAFWIAYILTRPLGASCGDYLAQPTANGGLGLGVTLTSTIFLGAISALVIYLTVTRSDSRRLPVKGAAKSP